MLAEPYIEFTDLGFKFAPTEARSDWILRDFNLTIGRGDFYVLLGPSGCGKTTALNILAGFERRTEGSVRVSGREVVEAGVDRAVIFQGDDSLYGWLTARENVEFGLRMAGVHRRERGARADAFLDRVGLKGQGHKYPSQLSGGMKQRIQIARALICKSPILLMDEPFGALDAQTRAILQDELASIHQELGATVLFITHDIAEAVTLGTRIGVMRAGPGAAIKEELDVDIERPRRRGDPRFGALHDRLQNILSDEVNKVLQRERAAS